VTVESVLATVARFCDLAIARSARAAVELEPADVQLLLLFGSVSDVPLRATHPWLVSDAAPVAVVIKVRIGVLTPTLRGPVRVQVNISAL
jgi:hypothetical protein